MDTIEELAERKIRAVLENVKDDIWKEVALLALFLLHFGLFYLSIIEVGWN